MNGDRGPCYKQFSTAKLAKRVLGCLRSRGIPEFYIHPRKKRILMRHDDILPRACEALIGVCAGSHVNTMKKK
jgi:hypothetical protein